jgi:hypothetical protein
MICSPLQSAQKKKKKSPAFKYRNKKMATTYFPARPAADVKL